MFVYRCIGGPLHSLAFLDHLAPINTKNLYLFFQFLKAVPLFTCFYCDAYKERKKTGTNTFICQPLEQDKQVLFSYSTFLGCYLATGEKKRQKVCCSPDPDPPLLFAIYYSCTLVFFLLVHCLGLAWCTQFTTPLAILLVHCWGIVLFYLLCEAACILTSPGSHSLHLQLTTLLSNTGPTWPGEWQRGARLECVAGGWGGVSGEWVPGRASERAEGLSEWLVGTVSGGLTQWRGTERD